MKYEFVCRIHNFKFGHDEKPAGVEFIDCPICATERNHVAIKEESTLLKQRDALLAAIEIKRTVELLKCSNQPGEAQTNDE